ncbi:DUF6777 domain-containing protein [Streptomyces sp. bgisy100]|uniref:DUF6777 domain-containing protein n=1 Tax=Streptomyces sp. bgisy100 TaxID=3413783 RepID=UPI003D718DA4
MTSPPPPGRRPTGPPSGPLSGRPAEPGSSGPPGASGPPGSSEPPEPLIPGPPEGPPPGGSGGFGGGPEGPGEPGGGGAGGRGPRRPWWRSVPHLAALAGLLAAAVAVILVLTRSADEPGTGEVFLQAATDGGRDPFTASTAEDSSAPGRPTATPSAPSATGGTPSITGSTPGLYGGTRNVASCNVEQQIDFLSRNRDKAAAFAGVVGIPPSRIPSYLRSLTPVQLRMDTRVTNHGYRNGEATAYQAVLQAGTAVLVGPHGLPRVRCACGNPLQPPVAVERNPKQAGQAWPGYQQSNVVVVAPASRVIDVFVLFDPETGTWFERRRGDDTARNDRRTGRPSDIPAASPAPPTRDASPPTRAPRTPERSEPPDTATSRPPETPTSAPTGPDSPAPDGTPP